MFSFLFLLNLLSLRWVKTDFRVLLLTADARVIPVFVVSADARVVPVFDRLLLIDFSLLPDPDLEPLPEPIKIFLL